MPFDEIFSMEILGDESVRIFFWDDKDKCPYGPMVIEKPDKEVIEAFKNRGVVYNWKPEDKNVVVASFVNKNLAKEINQDNDLF